MPSGFKKVKLGMVGSCGSSEVRWDELKSDGSNPDKGFVSFLNKT